MVYFYLLIFLSCVSALKIGYLTPIDTEKEFILALEAYTNMIATADPAKKIDVIKSGKNHNNKNETLSEIFKDFRSKSVSLVLTYCDDIIYNYDFSGDDKDIVVWCLNPVPPRLCSVNIIPGDMVGYSMETGILSFSLFYSCFYYGI